MSIAWYAWIPNLSEVPNSATDAVASTPVKPITSAGVNVPTLAVAETPVNPITYAPVIEPKQTVA